MKIVIPRKLLLVSCAVLTVNAYYLGVLAHWGNYYHGGGPLGAVIVDAFVLLAAFCCLEVFRSEKNWGFRTVAAICGVPLALSTAASLWYGISGWLC